MIWYNSAYNLNMLKYQLAMVRQLDLDPQLTPVHTKFMLFRRFRALLAAYIFLSCFLGVVGLVKDATHQSSEWTSLLGHLLSLCLSGLHVPMSTLWSLAPSPKHYRTPTRWGYQPVS